MEKESLMKDGPSKTGGLDPPPPEDPKPLNSGKRTNNKLKHGQDGVRDKQEQSLRQTGPVLGTNWDRPWDKPAVFCVIPQ